MLFLSHSRYSHVQYLQIGQSPSKSLSAQEIYRSIMKTNLLKTSMAPVSELSCILNIPQVVNTAQHNSNVMN